MPDGAAFLAAIRADPGAGTHLIYADWLDEHDRPALAVALRGKWGEPIAWALSRQPLIDTDGVLALLGEGWVPAYWPGFAAFVGDRGEPGERAILSVRRHDELDEIFRACVATTHRSNARRLWGLAPGSLRHTEREARPAGELFRVVDRFRLINDGSAFGHLREAYPPEEFAPLFPAGADLGEPPALWVPAAPAWGGLQVGLQVSRETPESSIK